MPSPGWYADPEDPSGLRWFDGENWTEHQQPQPSAATPDAWTQRTSAAADPWAQQTIAATPTTPAAPVAGTDRGAYAGATEQLPAYGSYAAAYQPAATTPVPEVQPSGYAPYQSAPYQSAPIQSAPYQSAPDDRWATAGYGAPPAPGAPAQAPAKRSRTTLFVVLAVVALLVLGAVGGWFLLRGSSTKYSLNGKTIEHPSDALGQAEQNLKAIVSRRHGAENASTRCYYALPTNPAAGAKKSDVDSAVRCGPVLFVDGKTTATYLSFALQPTAAGGGVQVTPSASPESNTPAALASDLALKRPDGKAPPSGAGGLEVPQPIAADANVLTTATTTQATGAPTTAVIGSLTGGVTIHDLGQITRYGTGDDARSAPTGQHLYAFTLGGAVGNNEQFNDLSSSVNLSIDGTVRPVPAAASGQVVVAAVPTSATAVDLVLNDSGLNQTFSLLSATPGTGNVAVLARTHRYDALNKKATVTLRYAPAVVFADKSTGTSQTATITLTGANLVYRDDVNKVTATTVGQAFLIPDIVFSGSRDGGPFGLDTSLLTFTPTGGAAIKAKNISSQANKIRNAFLVPAGVTSGTLTVSGTAVEKYNDGAGTYTVSVATATKFAVTFAAG